MLCICYEPPAQYGNDARFFSFQLYLMNLNYTYYFGYQHINSFFFLERQLRAKSGVLLRVICIRNMMSWLFCAVIAFRVFQLYVLRTGKSDCDTFSWSFHHNRCYCFQSVSSNMHNKFIFFFASFNGEMKQFFCFCLHWQTQHLTTFFFLSFTSVFKHQFSLFG